MSRSIVSRLILKDLYLLRWFSVGTTFGGLVAAALMTLSPNPIAAGGVLLICSLVILVIFLVMLGVVQERKDNVVVFVMSLPISPSQFVFSKVAANAITFLLPWSIVSAAAVTAVLVSPIPNGYVPLWVAILASIFFYYCALLGVGLNTTSNGWHAAAITVGNISVNFLIMLLFALPSVRTHGAGSAVVWTVDVVGIVATELVGGMALLALAIAIRLRHRDLI
jgi:ABC-type transport system involved in multi-copper enzyme maturation permease subunit